MSVIGGGKMLVVNKKKESGFERKMSFSPNPFPPKKQKRSQRGTSPDDGISVYESVFGRWSSDDDVDVNARGVLLSIAPGIDMSFPLHRENILIDHLERQMQPVIHVQLLAMFPDDLAFDEDAEKNRWCWSSAKRGVSIIYYYRFHWGKHSLPPEARSAQVLHFTNLEFIERFFPQFQFIPECQIPIKPKLDASKRRTAFLGRTRDMLAALQRLRQALHSF